MKTESHLILTKIVIPEINPELKKLLKSADNILKIPGIGGLKHYQNINNIYKKNSVFSRIIKYYNSLPNSKKHSYLLSQIIHLIQDISMPHHLNKLMFATHIQFENKLNNYIKKNLKSIKYKYNETCYLRKELVLNRFNNLEDILFNVLNNTINNKENSKELIIFNALYSTETFLEFYKNDMERFGGSGNFDFNAGSRFFYLSDKSKFK